MACTECSADQCPRGTDHYASVQAVVARLKDNRAGITLEELIEGITNRVGWFDPMRGCAQLVLSDDGMTYVAENRPTPGHPKIQYLTLMSHEEEERTRHTSRR